MTPEPSGSSEREPRQKKRQPAAVDDDVKTDAPRQHGTSEKWWLDIANMYDAKTQGSLDVMNRVLAETDGYFFNHNGLAWEGEDLPKPATAEEIHKLEHRSADVLAGFIGRLTSDSRVYDAGCGAGGNAIKVFQRWGARVHGVTLSPGQVQYALSAAASHGCGGAVTFSKGNMLEVKPDEVSLYDVIFFYESSEHLPDLDILFEAADKALKPRGTLVIGTWCATDGDRGDLMKTITDRHYLTSIHTHRAYLSAAEKLGFELRETRDLTTETARYWEYRGTSQLRTGSEAFMSVGFARRHYEYLLMKWTKSA